MSDQEVIDELRTEIVRLKRVVVELTEAVRVLSGRDNTAQVFIERIESILSDAEDAKDDAIEARDAAVDELRQEQERNN